MSAELNKKVAIALAAREAAEDVWIAADAAADDAHNAWATASKALQDAIFAVYAADAAEKAGKLTSILILGK